MVFPATPRSIQVELFLNGTWVDVSSDVYARDGITITHGARDETSTAEPSSCQLTLNNRSGNYSPRNPNGTYYGSVGRNTPLRVSIGKDTDSFTRTVSNGWGSTSGQASPYSTFGFGGTVAASDFNVTGTAGTHSVPTGVDGTRVTYLASQVYGDVDVSVTVSLSLASITGDLLGPGGLILRGVDSQNYSQVFVSISTDQHINVAVYDKIAGAFFLRSAIVDTGLVYSPSQPMRVRGSKEGQMLRVKVWQPNLTPEPYLWSLSAASQVTGSGWVGIESDTFSTNTNTSPVVFTYDDLIVRSVRYSGEVSYWPQRWDVSGNDVYVPIEAAGIKRRLGQGIAPVNSAMLTAVTSLATAPVAYWPCEDGVAATQLSPTIGTRAMSLQGATKLADFGGFRCSQPIPTLDVGTWTGIVPAYTGTGSVQLRYLIHVSSSEPPDTLPISQVFTSGTAPQWELKYGTGGNLSFNAWSPGGILYDSGVLVPDTGNLVDSLWMLCLTMSQNGANIDWRLDMLEVGDTVGSSWQATINSRTLGLATKVVIDPYQKMKGVSIGQIMVRTQSIPNVDIFDTSAGLNAFSGPIEIGGEHAAVRIQRLATATSLFIDGSGDVSDTALMGAQRPLPMLALMEEAAAADMGLLHESRGALTLFYRTRKSLYNQPAQLTLNYTGGQVAPPLEPVDDDQQTRNDIIAKRTDGGDFELFLSSGRLSVIDPWLGGVGVYQHQPTLNVDFDTQLPDVAGWQLLLGTVDEPRYPTIAINLANPNVVAAGLENAALSVNPGDRVVITNPKTGQTPDQIAQIVRGYTETLNLFEHIIVFNCAPAAPYDVIRADVTGKMTVDTGGSTLATGVNSTATTWSVATATGNDRWVTGAVALDLVCEGERFTVTNISGTSSPQTFTVTRSVNGVAKSHSAGAVIRLFRPALVGL